MKSNGRRRDDNGRSGYGNGRMDGGWTVIKKRLRKQDGTVTETGRDGNGSLTVAYVNP